MENGTKRLLLAAVMTIGSTAASLAAGDQGEETSSGGTTRLESAVSLSGHLLRSHSRDILLRPVSSFGNLASYVITATTGLIKDATLDLLLLPGVPEMRSPSVGQSRMDPERWELELDGLTGTRRTSGSLGLLVDGAAFFTRLEEEIRDARSSIRFRTYIFDNDDVALEIADLLKARAGEVRVQVLVDGIGTWGGGMIAAASQPDEHPDPVSIASYLRENSEIDLQVLGNAWLMGDHTKVFLFDDRTAFLGGMNIGREYRHDWHDLMVELSGPIVAQLSFDASKAARGARWGDLAFLKRIRRTAPVPGAEDVELRLLYTTPHDAQIYRAQLAAIKRSNDYIYIENAYLADDQVIYELIKASRRGVDVRIIVPQRSDSELMNRSNSVALNLLREHGVRVYLYPGMSHVKAAIYDGWACLGTANFDKLSFKINKEVNVATADPDVVRSILEAVFERDFRASTELSAPRPLRFADHALERVVDVLL